MARFITVLLSALALVAAGCGSDSDEGGSPVADPAITEGPGETVKDGRMAGSIAVSPDTAEAGGRISWEVINEGKSPLTHGVCPGFERLVGEGWVDATEELLGGSFACIEIAAVVAPGARGGKMPLNLAEDVEGTFRVVLQVTGEDGTSIVLRDAFAVYPP